MVTPAAGLFFWDYGNSFLLEARRAGADVGVRGGGNESASSSIDFRYPSYVQDIMGYSEIHATLGIRTFAIGIIT